MHEGLHISLKAETLGVLWGVPITNTTVMSVIATLLLVFLGWRFGKDLRKIPSRTQAFFELLFDTLVDYFESVLGSRAHALRFFPLLATLFLFILMGNWLGLIPGIGSLTMHSAHEGGAMVSLLHPISVDMNVTLALAIIAFLVIEVSGIAFLGIRKHLGKFFSLRSPLAFFVGLIEFVSEWVRIISFSFRLFGNMFAGKTLILVATFFVPFLLPVPLMLYETLVGFIQAALFTLLTLFFIKLAMSEAH
jgi:F-type H+-transporting ATPase subunit a